MNLGNVTNVGAVTALKNSGGLSGLARYRTFSAPLTHSILVLGKGSTTPTYSRASTAYVRDHEGIERQVLTSEARFWGSRRVYNQCPYSQAFDNAAWVKADVTFDADAITAPDGTLTADFANETATTAAHAWRPQHIAVTSGNRYLYSCYVKRKDGSRRYAAIACANVFAATQGAVIDFDTGTVSSWSSGAAALAIGVVDAGDGWWRIWALATAVVTSASGQFFMYTSQDGVFANRTYLGVVGEGVYFWGAQLEDVTGQSVQTPSEYVSTNVLSLPYHGANVDGVQYFDSIRLHTQNLLTYSEDQSNAAWTKGGNVSCSAQDSIVFGGVGNSSTDRVSTPVNVSSLNGRANRTFRYVISLPPAEMWTDPTVSITLYDSYTATSTSATPASGVYTTLTLTGTWPTAAGASNGTLIIFSNKASTVSERIRAYAQDITGNNINNTYVITSGTTNFGTDTGDTEAIPATTIGGIFRETGVTNLLRQSQTFDNATWSKDVDLAVTADNVVAPDGTLTADTCTEGGAGTARIRQFTIPIAANGLYSWTIYARRTSTVQWINVALSDDAADVTGVRAWFDILNGVAGNITAFGTGTAGSIYIEALPNGWYRCYGNGTVDAASTNARLTVHSCSANGNTTRVASSIYALWGGQVELATTALGGSSYIPTTTATVARSADALSYPFTNNFTITEGTMYAETTFFPRTTTNSIIFGLNGLAAYPLFYGGSRTLAFYDGTNFTTVSGTLAMFTRYKIAAGYGASTTYAARAGANASGVFNNTFTGTPTAIGQYTCYGLTKNLRLYSKKLTTGQINSLVA